MKTDKHGLKKLLLRHETVLLFVLGAEWLYFNSVGRNFGSLDNSFDIVRHSVEIGLLALGLLCAHLFLVATGKGAT